MSKPAFKVGVVHHPVAPIGAGFHKPNIFSTNLNKSVAPPTPKVATRPTKARQTTRPVTTTAAVTGRVTRSKAANVKVDVTDANVTQKRTVSSTKLSVATTKQQKTSKPAINTTKASFAPDNFEFKLNIPLQSVVEEIQESPNNKEEEPKAFTPVNKSSQREDTKKVLKKYQTTPKTQKPETPPKLKEKVESPKSNNEEDIPVTKGIEKSPELHQPEEIPQPAPVTPEPDQPRGRRR